MITKLHCWFDFLSGFDFEYGRFYYEIDDAVAERYKKALREYELAEKDLCDQYQDPARKRDKVDWEKEEQEFNETERALIDEGILTPDGYLNDQE